MSEKNWDKVENLFAQARSEEAEVDLKNDIMNKIDREKYGPKAGAKKFRITRNSWNSAAFRTWFYVAAGVTVAALLITLYWADFGGTKEDRGKMKGTFFNSAQPGDYTNAETIMYQGWQVKASCRTRYSANTVELYLDLSSDDVIETTVGFNPDDFDFQVVVRQQVDDNTTISTATDHVTIISSHSNLIGIKLTNKNDRQHDIRFNITQRGNPLYENTITVNKTAAN